MQNNSAVDMEGVELRSGNLGINFGTVEAGEFSQPVELQEKLELFDEYVVRAIVNGEEEVFENAGSGTSDPLPRRGYHYILTMGATGLEVERKP